MFVSNSHETMTALYWDIGEMLNFQNVGGKAKPYQVRQFIKIVENHNLLEEFEHDV